MKTEREHRLDMVAVGRLLYEKNLVVASDGNISIRLPRGRLLSTPSGVNKGLLKPEQLVVTDMKGEKISGAGKPTSELRLHLAIYEERPDVGAVVHAHPPIATAFTVAGVRLTECVIPEVVFTLGAIPTSEYATPTSEQGPVVIKKLIHGYDAVILDRHGAVTCGPDVWDAYKKMEKVEHAAMVTWYARQLGEVKTLPKEEVERLMRMHEALGLPGRITVFVNGDGGGVPRGAAAAESPAPPATAPRPASASSATRAARAEPKSAEDALVERITDAVMSRLESGGR